MAAKLEYTQEQLNYYRICYVTTDILTDGLRTIFKQEWDNRYTATKGEWKDEPRNGTDFWNMETPRNQTRNARLWNTMINGNRSDWDCTMLFYAILYSDCIHSLNPVVQSNVDDLRKFRNEEFAHMPQGHLTDAEFQNAISIVEVAFLALGLPTARIQEIRNQTSFPTEELRDVLKKVDDLKQEVQALEDQLNRDVSPFCILPPKPSHDVAGREHEVANITEQLKQLKKANENSLSYLYISGNPGSGKSQLAGLVAKRFFEEEKEVSPSTSFVMTVNAESSKTLLESYVSFARLLKCPEYAVTNTLNSEDTSTDEKISNLKTLISAKIKHYTSWLLVVDTVISISDVYAYLPEHGSEQWARGQLLITTQDTQSIPLTSSFLHHISVSKGMEPIDACSLLSTLSGIDESEMQREVAQALDHQPLALASAAIYVKQIRQNRMTANFGWKDYLKKLEKGQRGTTEAILSETNPSYQTPMTKAIALAVEKMMASDKVIHHTFTLFALCAPQPLSLEIMFNYILNTDEEIEDKEAIGVKIQRCSLLLFEEEKSNVYIRVHQVVHDAINTVIKDLPEIQHIQDVNSAVRSFSQFVKDYPTVGSRDLDSLVYRKYLVGHLKLLVKKVKGLFPEEDVTQVAKSTMSQKCCSEDFEKLARVCEADSEFYAAKEYYNLALTTIRRSDSCKDRDVARLSTRTGNVHARLGEFNLAKENYKCALSICLKEGGPEDDQVTCIINNFGNVQRELGKLEQAKECYALVLASLLTTLGPEHVAVAPAYINLGALYIDLGNLEQAKEWFNNALHIYLKKLGPEHVDVASAYFSLGNLHTKLGNLEQAKESCDRALAIRLKKLGPEHVDVARAYHSVGVLHNKQGAIEQAKDCYDRALDIYLKKLGPDHVFVASAYLNLGSIHRNLGNLEQAKGYYDHALNIRLKKLGTEHFGVARVQLSLGTLHRDRGNLEQAKECYDRALDIFLRKLGPEHVHVAVTYNNLGTLHEKLGALKQAKECYDRAQDIFLKKLGPEHLNVAVTYNSLGMLHNKLGALEQAKNYFERALDIYLKKLGPEHVNVAHAYNNLGNGHNNLGNVEKAKECYDRAQDIFLKKLGPEHVNVANVLQNFGNVHWKLGNLEQAKECYDRALDIYLKKLGPEHALVSTVQRNLSNLAELQQFKEIEQRLLTLHQKRCKYF